MPDQTEDTDDGVTSIGEVARIVSLEGDVGGSTSVHLICSIGTGSYQPTTYTLDGISCETRFAPVALARVRGFRGRASVLVTREARERWYEAIAAEFQEAGLAPSPVDVPEGRDTDERAGIVEALLGAARPDGHGQPEPIVLDVTFALRHLPFVYLAVLTYLTAFQEVELRGIYYGAYELRGSTNGAPIVDLTDLYQLTRWYQAVQTATHTGDLRAAADLLRQDVGNLFRSKAGRPDLSRVKDRLESVSQALASGLPVEVGIEAARLNAELSSLGPVTPHHRLALDRLRAWLQPLVSSHRGQKTAMPLDEAELERQVRLADWYNDRLDAPKTLLLLREWLVNLVMARSGHGSNWLPYRERKPFERHLAAVAARAREGLADPPDQALASLWDEISGQRNKLAHAGMTEDDPTVAGERVRGWIQRCRDLLSNQEIGSIDRQATPRVLVTPLGLSPGVLYTGILRAKPDKLIVVTSEAASSRLDEACDAAGAGALPRVLCMMADPHAGYQEAGSLIAKADMKSILVNVGEVVINLTGGTTAMQLVVERIASTARRLGTPVRRVMLIDTRPVEQQRSAPYELGEMIDLEDDDHTDTDL